MSTDVAPVTAPVWTRATFAWGVACVLVMRILYLLRFGWDPGWMNLGYLSHARMIALGQRQVDEEQPLAHLALVAARALGLSAVGANEAVYLLAHALFAAGALGVARFVWPRATARRRAILIGTVAVLPLLATHTGRNNLGVALAAGLTASALALAGTLAAARDPRRASAWSLFAATAIVTAIGGTGRYEAIATGLGGALVLAVLGPRMPDVPGARRAALALALGAAGGLAVALIVRRALGTGAAAAGGASKTYAFYTFFDGLPIAMFPHLPSTEYARYRASFEYFGGFEQNHGSLLHALLHHPGWTFLRFATKPLDLAFVMVWIYGLTPVGAALAVVGVRGIARRTWARGWLLLAYAFAVAMLFVPQPNPAYYLSIAVPLVLVVTRGADRFAARWPARTARRVGVATVLAGVVFVIAAGKLGVSNSRVLNEVAADLEARCQDGCLLNVLPQAVREQAWVVTDAGAPFPAREHRDERVIFGRVPPARTERYEFCARVRRARAGGFQGAVLYLEPRIRSFQVFDPNFDPEVRYEGAVDRAHLIEERRFASGGDEAVLYRVPPGHPCFEGGAR